MYFNYRYRLYPDEQTEGKLVRHIDICRQLYNHFLHELDSAENFLSYTAMQNMLPDLKGWWDELSCVYSKVLQMVARRVSDNLQRLKGRSDNGQTVGTLNWKSPREYRSLTYNQVGFELKNTSDRPTLALSKIGTIPIRVHRPLPSTATVKQVTIKREKTGRWYAIFGVEDEEAAQPKPELSDVERNEVVGIDVGLSKYTHDTDSTMVEPPDTEDVHARLSRAQQKLSRKERGSKNWQAQRRRVAKLHAKLVRKQRDFLHKLSAYYAREYELVAVEDLNVAGLIELPANSKNRARASWRTFIDYLEYKCEREGTHFVKVDPKDTTRNCASCGTKVEKALWVREHCCPTCGFETDRDENAAYNVLQRALNQVDAGHIEVTPAETALPTSTAGRSTAVVDAKCVVETGSPREQQ